eukprot:m.35793 g.35793  ORF g.35793 m.35793 type:complete len:166 (+) comp17204_c0_seq1:331-828(+)
MAAPKVSNQIQSPTLDASVVEAYHEINKRGSKKIWAIFFHDEVANTITVEQISEEPFSKMAEALPAKDYRWALFNGKFSMVGGGNRAKLSLVTWVPDALDRGSFKATVRAKSLATMFAGMIKREVPACVCFFQANDPDDVSDKQVLERISKFEKDPVDIAAGLQQ